MAISPELFVQAPPYPPEVKEEPKPPTPLSVDQALAKLDKKLERAAKEVRSLFRLASLWSKYGSASLHLFSMNVSEQVTMIEGEKHGPITEYIVPKKDFHDAAFALMQHRYGLDPNMYTVKRKTPYSNGTIRELRYYPSQTVKGLIFERWHDYIEATNQPVRVEWEIGDKLPFFPLNFSRFSSSNPSSAHILEQSSR